MPVTGEQLLLAGVRVFATMNPAAAGGNRHQLPPSLAALFTHVRLAAPSDAELSCIATSVFAGCITEGLVREDHVASVLALHCRLEAAMEARELGAGGGVAHLTLRDLIKVRAAACQGGEGSSWRGRLPVRANRHARAWGPAA